MVSQQTLKAIANRLEGTGGTLLSAMRECDVPYVTGAIYETEIQLEVELGFGYCKGCEMWGYEVEDGLCPECQDEANMAL